jgi:hypothetical protein
MVTRLSLLMTFPPDAALTNVPAARTARVAELLVTDPAELLTLTENFAPESVVAVDPSV